MSAMTIPCPACGNSKGIIAPSSGSDCPLKTCLSCGHEWTDVGANSHSHSHDHPLMLAARHARENFIAEKRRRQIKVAAWAGLMLCAASPFLAALALPDRIVSAAPASIALYEWLGREVNIHGIDIGRLTVEQSRVDGRPEITVTGELTNISAVDRSPPRLRFALRNHDAKEIHSWQLEIGRKPLQPGEIRPFTTRISTPFKTARKVEIRFARADEIGSNDTP